MEPQTPTPTPDLPDLDLSEFEEGREGEPEGAEAAPEGEPEVAEAAPEGEPEGSAPEGAEPEASPAGDAVGTVQQSLAKLTERLAKDDEPLDEGLLQRFAEDGGLDSLDPVSQTLVRQAHAAARKAEAEASARVAAMEQRIASAEAELKRQWQAFRAERAEFAKLARNPQLQQSIAAGLAIKDGEIDPYTAEGRAKLMQREIAQKMHEFTAPLTQNLDRFDRERQIDEVFAANPGAEAHKAEIAKLLRQRREAGAPLALQDAITVVMGQQALQQQRATLEKRRAARRDANNVTRGGSRGAGSALNLDNIEAAYSKVVADGYKGLDGAMAGHQWLTDNPRAAELLNKSLGLV